MKHGGECGQGWRGRAAGRAMPLRKETPAATCQPFAAAASSKGGLPACNATAASALVFPQLEGRAAGAVGSDSKIVR